MFYISKINLLKISIYVYIDLIDINGYSEDKRYFITF